MTELLPCPFCGGKPKEKTSPAGSEGAKFFASIACYCGGYSSSAFFGAIAETEFEAKAKAAKLWNYRASPWRPMAECPGCDTERILAVFKDGHTTHVTETMVCVARSHGAIAWMPIPPYTEETK